MSAAAHIDSTYAQLLSEAIEQGVEVLAYKARISASEEVEVIDLKPGSEIGVGAGAGW